MQEELKKDEEKLYKITKLDIAISLVLSLVFIVSNFFLISNLAVILLILCVTFGIMIIQNILKKDYFTKKRGTLISIRDNLTLFLPWILKMLCLMLALILFFLVYIIAFAILLLIFNRGFPTIAYLVLIAYSVIITYFIPLKFYKKLLNVINKIFKFPLLDSIVKQIENKLNIVNYRALTYFILLIIYIIKNCLVFHFDSLDNAQSELLKSGILSESLNNTFINLIGVSSEALLTFVIIDTIVTNSTSLKKRFLNKEGN